MKINKQQLTREHSPPLIKMQQNEYICCLFIKQKIMKKTILILTVFSIFFSCKKDKPYEPFIIPCTIHC